MSYVSDVTNASFRYHCDSDCPRGLKTYLITSLAVGVIVGLMGLLATLSGHGLLFSSLGTLGVEKATSLLLVGFSLALPSLTISIALIANYIRIYQSFRKEVRDYTKNVTTENWISLFEAFDKKNNIIAIPDEPRFHWGNGSQVRWSIRVAPNSKRYIEFFQAKRHMDCALNVYYAHDYVGATPTASN